MGLLAKVIGNMTAGAARSLNGKFAGQAAQRNAQARGNGDGGCSPCKARAMQYEVQKSLGVKGWYKQP